MIIRAAVIRINLKNFTKNHLRFLAMATSTTTDAMAWNIFPHTVDLENFSVKET